MFIPHIDMRCMTNHLPLIHIHDSSGLIDHLEIGKGKLDFYQYLDILKPFPYTLAIESRDEADPEGCVLRSRNTLMKLLDKSGD